MKAIQLKQIIREEVRKIVNETDSNEYTIINLWDKIDGKFRIETVPASSADTAFLSYLKMDNKYADYGAQEAMAYIKKSTKLVEDGDIIMYLGKGTFDPDYIVAPGQIDRKAALQILKDKVFSK